MEKISRDYLIQRIDHQNPSAGQYLFSSPDPPHLLYRESNPPSGRILGGRKQKLTNDIDITNLLGEG